ncbi:hypothetical protein DFH08DRAFT_1013175 [Mycena albidolilacea]|uniref:CxC2-like cysteine cluster KDZ transposase-associated domain-containing protein n=1 Tax=Mycena albidolilacea TaxID=1033008 RepID=A0AAD6ZTZ7_9AGAR|nr:hypothetical protein DFH08DRAFT_1013175 [Mycena albidolilacea]
MADKKRKRAAPKIERRIIAPPPTILATRHVNIHGNKTVSVEEKLVGVRSVETPVASPAADSRLSEDTNDETGTTSVLKTQTAQLMEEYGDKFPDIIRLWVAHKSSTRVGSQCYCGNGVRNTQCRDCRQYDLSCEACWINNHRNNPFHWAYIWNPQLGFFVKHDISAVDGGGHAVTLGHYGKPCPNAGNSQMMTIVEPNGIHATRLHFCGCSENPSVDSRFDQLMQAGYFPGSTHTPRTAFAFDVLRRFHLASLESKTAALDYISCLRRLTDNATTATVPDPYPAFLPASRMYRHLKMTIRLGQAHGIDDLTPYRPEGNLLVHCPVCPEIGVNVNVDVPPPPLYLRHLLQQQMTLDGNFHTGHFAKNCDPNDVSLCDGKAHFPPDKKYRAYLNSVPLSKEKSTCTYLKAVNRQDKKKFKNMDVTGTINAQCSHVFVVATVDMHHSERFANADAALARMLRKITPGKDADIKVQLAYKAIDKVLTYDIIKERFQNSPDLEDVAGIIDCIRWGIPALHVTGHKSDCTYLFGTAYMDCVGHFHGETAEAYWPSANKIGGHARQANNGHRQDMLVDNANDWNWKKIVNMHVSLYDDLLSAKKLFLEKRKLFIGLSLSHPANIPAWRSMARQTKKGPKGVISVYRHTASKGEDEQLLCGIILTKISVPSQTAIYERMKASLDNFASTQVSTNQVGLFLNEGMKIQDNQRKIKDACVKNAEHDLQETKKEIASRRTKLTAQIDTWRKVRERVLGSIPDAAEFVAMSQTCEVEDEKLWLPSEFTVAQRVAMGHNMIALAEEEGKLREGEAYKLIRCLQSACKTLSALEDRKRLDETAQKGHTTAGEQILDTRRRRDNLIDSYNYVRKAMISLGTVIDHNDEDSQFPFLSVKDTFTKSRRRERALGDSRRGDGMLYTRIGIATGSKISHAPEMDIEESSEEEISDRPKSKRSRPAPEGGVQMTKRAKRAPAQKRKEKEPDLSPNPANKNGWLWELRRPSNMSEAEMAEWESEGKYPYYCDRVQWARAEAEMDRFQEQMEIKLTEFLRCLTTFQFNERAWIQMSKNSDLGPGFAEWAKGTAQMWKQLSDQCQTHLTMAGYKFALEPDFNLVSYVERERENHDNLLREQGIGIQYPGINVWKPRFFRPRGERQSRVLKNTVILYLVKPTGGLSRLKYVV